MNRKIRKALIIFTLLVAIAINLVLIIVMASAMNNVMGSWAGPTFIIAICIVCLLAFAIVKSESE